MGVRIKKICSILLGVLIIVISVNMFLGPHNIAAGGLTGFALIMEYVTGVDRSIYVMVFNVLLLALTYFLLGKEIFFNTVIGALSLPVLLKIVPHITLVEDVMLSALIGSVLFGAASAVLYRNNASSGGTSIPPLIFKKYFDLNVSAGLFATDFIIVLLSLIVFDVGPFFYAIVSIGISSATLSYMETGFNRKKTVFIISEKNDIFLDEILHVVKRGVTIIPIVGGYNKKPMNMLMVTLNIRDYHSVISAVNKWDEKAFVITYPVSDVHGLGFTYHSGSV